jgi:nucleoside-diphosphate-sugar epimerase
MVAAYLQLLREPDARVDGQIFNVGGRNHSVAELGEIVRAVINPRLPIEVRPSDDQRSYRISSEKIRRQIGWQPRRTVADAVRDLAQAMEAGKVHAPLDNPLYFNIKRMQELRVV